MEQIVREYEDGSADDNEKTKKDRFERILDNMQKLQQLGHPPKEIVGDMVVDRDSIVVVFHENNLCAELQFFEMFEILFWMTELDLFILKLILFSSIFIIQLFSD